MNFMSNVARALVPVALVATVSTAGAGRNFGRP